MVTATSMRTSVAFMMRYVTVVELVLNSSEVTLLEHYTYSCKSVPDSIVWCQVVMNSDNRYLQSLNDSDNGCIVMHLVCSLVTCVIASYPGLLY